MDQQQHQGKRKAIAIATVAVLLIVGGIAFAVWRPFAAEPAAIAVERRDLVELVEVAGVVEPERRVTLKAEVQGVVEALPVPENERVATGTPLLRLDPTQARLQLAQARANAESSLAQAATSLDSARKTLADAESRQAVTVASARTQLAKAESAMAFLEAELRRNRALLAEGAITRQAVEQQAQQLRQARLDMQGARENLDRALGATEVVQARNALAQAQAAITSARKQGGTAVALAEEAVRRTTLRAPFAGTVTAWSVDRGDQVAPGAPLGVFQDLEALRLRLPVDELDLPKMRPGGPVAITFDAYPDSEVRGRIAEISRSSVEGSGGVRVFPVEVAFEDAQGTIRPGMSGDARVILQEKRGVLAIPIGAVRRDGDRFVVSRLDAQGRPETVPIEVGIMTLEHLEVKSGLTEGDRILPAAEAP